MKTLRNKARKRLAAGILGLALGNIFAPVQATQLVTLRNSSLSIPAATIASMTSTTNLVGSNFLLSAVGPGTAQGALATLHKSRRWVRHYKGGPAIFDDFANAIAVRANGSVVVTGESGGSGTGYDFATIAYTTDGVPLWTNRYDGPNHGDDNARFVATAPNGDCWVVGSSTRYPTNFLLRDLVTIKYASNGVPVWTNRHSSFETNSSQPYRLVVDAMGYSYVAYSAGYWSGTTGTPIEMAIIKYDPSGNLVWSKHYFDPPKGPNQEFNEVAVMVLDDTGNLFVAGRAADNSAKLIIKFAPDGTALWTNQTFFQVIDGFAELSLNRQGEVISTGERWSNNIRVYVTMKCSPTGISLWTNTLAGAGYAGGNVPQSLLDPTGNIFLIGGSLGAEPGLYQILKLNSNGIPQWTNQTAVLTNGMIQASAIDYAGNLYLTGFAPEASGFWNCLTHKYSPAGQPLWIDRFNEHAIGDCFPGAIAVDGYGNAYVAGSVAGPVGREFFVVKYGDVLMYAPPKDFTGLDTITVTLTDYQGTSATGTVQVLVTLGAFRFDLSSPSLKLIPAGMQLSLQGIPGTNEVILQASSNLHSWDAIRTNVPLNGALQFLDPGATNRSRRFYRAFQQQ